MEMLCYVTPNDRFGLSNRRDGRDGVIIGKPAVHAAALAKGRPGERIGNNAPSKACFESRWEDQLNLGLDPDKAGEDHPGRARLCPQPGVERV